MLGEPQGIGDPANRADDGAATALEQIAHDLSGEEVVLHDQDPHSVEAFGRLSHRVLTRFFSAPVVAARCAAAGTSKANAGRPCPVAPRPSR